jgi:hypothetical protein
LLDGGLFAGGLVEDGALPGFVDPVPVVVVPPEPPLPWLGRCRVGALGWCAGAAG